MLQSLFFPFPLQIFVGLTSNAIGGGFSVVFFFLLPQLLTSLTLTAPLLLLPAHSP